MLTVGVDAHKRISMAVAIDEVGREVACWRGPNTSDGWCELAPWRARLGDASQWGIEGAWTYGRGLAQQLVAAGAIVYEVNARLTAEGRRHARRSDKTDRLDARAVARAVQREGTLPRITAEDETTIVAHLVAERDELIAEATRLRNRLHQLLLQLDPDYRSQLPSLTSRRGMQTVAVYTTADTRPLVHHRAQMVQRLAQRLALVVEQARVLEQEIAQLVAQRWMPLTEICGVNTLTAGALAALLGPGRRFTRDAQLAAYAGVAPVEASSAERVRHRLNRGGNRHLNAILHRIAVTQARRSPQAQAYVQRRVAEGKTKREALRALKRHLVRAIWRQWQVCLASTMPVTKQIAA